MRSRSAKSVLREGAINFQTSFKKDSYDMKLEKAEVSALKNSLKGEAAQLVGTFKIEELCRGSTFEKANKQKQSAPLIFMRLTRDLKEIKFCELNDFPDNPNNVDCTDSCNSQIPH